MITSWEFAVFWSTVLIALFGGLAALAARLFEQLERQAMGQLLFFSAMFSVATVTLVALAAGQDCWLSGGSTLLFMALVGTLETNRTRAEAI